MVIPLTGVVWEMGWLFIPITAGLLVSFTNAVNLIDGLDGLAGGTVAIACVAFGVIAALAGQTSMALFAFLIVGALGARRGADDGSRAIGLLGVTAGHRRPVRGGSPVGCAASGLVQVYPPQVWRGAAIVPYGSAASSL